MRKLFIKNVKSFSKDEKGATMVEYGILIALIAVASITAITTFSGDLQGVFNALGTKLTTKATPS